MSVNVDGHSDSANIINSISMALSGTTLTTTVNGRSASTSIASALSSGKYITSGFSAYNGHSAIGASAYASNGRLHYAWGIGELGEVDGTAYFGIIDGISLNGSGSTATIQGPVNCYVYLDETRDTSTTWNYRCAIVF